jgi:hypothetical protein
MARDAVRSPAFAKGRAPSPQEFVKQWPTPTVCGNYNRKGASTTSGDGLATAVRMWPTPTCPNGGRSVAHVTDWRSERTAYTAKGKKVQVDLAQAVKRWPTPTSTLGTNGGKVTPTKAREGGTLIEALSARTMWRTPGASVVEPKSTVVKLTGRKPSDPQVGLADQVGGSLNPTWVEWLMGWPLGWTDLKPLATDRCLSVQPPHGDC